MAKRKFEKKQVLDILLADDSDSESFESDDTDRDSEVLSDHDICLNDDAPVAPVSKATAAQPICQLGTSGIQAAVACGS